VHTNKAEEGNHLTVKVSGGDSYTMRWMIASDSVLDL
jgi:hypothetical protein